MGKQQQADNFRHKIICDPVHGDIGLSELEQRLIDSPSFQRLRHLKQLGLASLVYPNASHSRFAHSLGVFHIMGRIIDLLVQKGQVQPKDKPKLRLAALLHDIGHYPYSHLMELLDKDIHRPNYLVGPNRSGSTTEKPRRRYPLHEKIGQIVITERLDVAGTLTGSGFDPEEIAKIIRGEHNNPVYNQLIHSSLDVDRMDYLVRDSLGTGVPYGHIDINYILNNLDVAPDGEIVVTHKAAAAVEHFLVARYFMHKTVYMHKTTFAFEALMRHILFLLREKGKICRDGNEVEEMVRGDEFLDFHDGYIDRIVDDCLRKRQPKEAAILCEALRRRLPPKLVHEETVLRHESQDRGERYALFVKDRSQRIKDLAKEFHVEPYRWIWEDPKNISFESLGPFVALSQSEDIKPEETRELVRIKDADGTIRKLVEEKNSIIHHLSQLRLTMSRLYVVGPVSKDQLGKIRTKVLSWL